MKIKSKNYPSIASAAASLKVSESILKNAKRMGCDAFSARGSVDGKKLMAFISEHEKELSSGGVALRDQKTSEEVRKLRIRNDKDERKLVARADVTRDAHETFTFQKQMLTQKLVNEYPSAVAGLEVASARVYGRRLLVSICESTQEFIKRWEK